MPTYTPYPGPGKGLRITGLDKNGGWGTRTPGGQLVRVGDFGINKTAGKALGGLDQNTNPVISSTNVTGITGTAANVVWTTQVATPLGSLRWRVAGNPATAAAWATVAEAGTPPLTSHSIPLSGMTAGVVYEYEVTQPQTGGVLVGKQIYQGRIVAGVALLAASGAPDPPPSSGLDVQAAQREAPPALPVTNLQVEAESPTTVSVTWRTEAYADGSAEWEAPDGQTGEEFESGNKRLNHSVLLTGLAPGTTYSVWVHSEDAAGAQGEGGPVAVTTPAA